MQKHGGYGDVLSTLKRDCEALTPHAQEACLAGSVDSLLSYLFDSPVASRFKLAERERRDCTYIAQVAADWLASYLVWLVQ